MLCSIIGCTSWAEVQTIIYSYQIVISGLLQEEVRSLLSEVGQKTAIGHEGHDNVGGWASISTDSDQTQDIGMVEVLHLHTFLHDVVDFSLIKGPCSAWVCVVAVHGPTFITCSHN